MFAGIYTIRPIDTIRHPAVLVYAYVIKSNEHQFVRVMWSIFRIICATDVNESEFDHIHRASIDLIDF